MDITPYAYQQEILDKLEAERAVRGYTHNLAVAATGTGKTVISALDYKRFRRQNPDKPCRLLFAAHRKEILKQSLYTFRAVLKDADFGEIFVGSYQPRILLGLTATPERMDGKSVLPYSTTVSPRKSACRKPLTESFRARSSISASLTPWIWTP